MVLLGLASGCVPVPGLGGSSPLARGCRSLLSQGEERSPAEPSQGQRPLLHAGFAEQICPCSLPRCHEGWYGWWQTLFFQT